MSPSQREALAHYVRWVANEMGLRDWEIVLGEQSAETEHAVAEIECVHGRKLARVFVAEFFLERDADTQRAAIVHELVHCHLAPVQHQVEYDLEHELGRTADRLFSAAFRRNLEYAVDGLTAALAPRMPHIQWP